MARWLSVNKNWDKVKVFIHDNHQAWGTLGARALCDRSEGTVWRLWSHKHPASLWWVQYLNSVCGWSKFMRVFSLIDRCSLVNQSKDSHKYWPITNRVHVRVTQGKLEVNKYNFLGDYLEKKFKLYSFLHHLIDKTASATISKIAATKKWLQQSLDLKIWSIWSQHNGCGFI